MKQSSSQQYWEFAARLGVSVAVLGSAFALGSVSVSTVSTLLNQKTSEVADRSATDYLAQNHLLTPVEKQIAEHEELLERIQNPANKEVAQKRLANLYVQLATKHRTLQDFTKTEMALQKAISLDSSNPDYMAQLAGLYQDRARGQGNASMRVALYRSSRQYYRQASRRARQPQAAQTYVSSAGATSVSLARDLIATGQRTEVNAMLQEAKTWAPPEVVQQIAALLNR